MKPITVGTPIGEIKIAEEFLTRSLISNPHQNIERKTAPVPKADFDWEDLGNGYVRNIPKAMPSAKED